MYQCKKFTIYELAHPQIINAIGEHNTWLRLDEFCLQDLDFIRKKWGDTIYINQGPHDSRGLRPPDDPDGSFYSVHKQGKAFDLVPANGDADGLFDMIVMLIASGELAAFNALEHKAYTVHRGWVHVACMNTEKKPLIVKP